MNSNLQRKWHDVIQNSDEWFNLRLKKATSSNFDKICANMGKAFGNPAKEYAEKKALEIVTGQHDEIGYRNKFMERGSELEPLAIERYELETFNSVTNGGFTEYGNYGDSTDGMVGDRGCIEVKSVIPNTQWKNIKRGGSDPSYKWQYQGHLFVSDKDWCDYISYCPEFPPKKQIHIYTIERDMIMQEQLEERLEKFWNLVLENVKIIEE
ncbi:hypothetical protein AAU57_12165 [Nonlabens sp. YIK11]|uniref:lambda exonuclease family protein n=1 Tax=Nonlabens sp. YIK11 TaxID=1453349 RepID=UPI000708239A|nr:lambda exonuclease family protein [Nonlabens sp. YIK11]KQC34001.1 hypothetical protein AAU57_12165 [Nonlabens sp. YIK11]